MRVSVRKVIAAIVRGESRQRRGRLEAAFARGLSCPVIPESATKDRDALAFRLGGALRAGAVYRARADEWEGVKLPQSITTGGAWPKGPSKSVGIGNSCASTVRTYVRTYLAGEDSEVWEHLRFLSLDADTDEVLIAYVE